MSIRIQNDGVAAATNAQAAPAANAAQKGSSLLSGSIAPAGADQVDLSPLSGNIAATVGALASQQASRVSQLAALYSKGEYPVDSAQLSRALVQRAMSSDAVEGDM